MAEAVHPLLAHFEAHLGLMQTSARLRDGLFAIPFKDRPSRGASSFLSLGLSHHVFGQEQGPGLRIEFLLSCWDEFVAPLNPASVLADVCDQALELHSAPPRGTVLGPRGRFFAESEMEALYCAAPVYFDDALAEFNGFAEPFVLIWLVPITPAEASYVRERGWDAFEDLLDVVKPDLLNLARKSVVVDGLTGEVGPERAKKPDPRPTFVCRVCALESSDPKFCNECLAETMRPA